jgi:hypothetical protein
MLTVSTRESTHHFQLGFAGHVRETDLQPNGGGGGVGVLVNMRFYHLIRDVS